MLYDVVVYCSSRYAECLDRMYEGWVFQGVRLVHVFSDRPMTLKHPKIVIHPPLVYAEEGPIHRRRRAEVLLQTMLWDTGETEVGAYVLIDADVWVNALSPLTFTDRLPTLQADTFDLSTTADTSFVVVLNTLSGLNLIRRWVELQSKLASQDHEDQADDAFQIVYTSNLTRGVAARHDKGTTIVRADNIVSDPVRRAQTASIVHFNNRSWERPVFFQMLGGLRGRLCQ